MSSEPSLNEKGPRELTLTLPDLKTLTPCILLTIVLLAAAILRFSGRDWDSGTHMHPDERFLTMVETGLEFPETLGEYFNTAESKLNPHNLGHPLFVYGTFPIFLVRLLGGWMDGVGYDQIHLLGRSAAAAFDVLSVFLVYLIGRRLYNWRVAILGAAFSAFSVLLIQHSHFFVVDAFANTFILAGLYFAVRAMQEGRVLDYALFGVSLGMSVASKISAAPIAAVIALAALARWYQAEPESRPQVMRRSVWLLALAAALSLLTFRILQPYAFQGPTFFGIGLNPAWLDDLKELAAMVRGDVDFPPALQWANRFSLLYAFENLIRWGMGLPLGVLAWLGWGWAFSRALRGDWQRHLLLVAWTGGHFLWRGSGFSNNMRYHLPIYPTLALLAAWALWEAWHRADSVRERWRGYARIGVAALGAFVLASTMAYAVAFARNYTLPFTRFEASQWIYENVPGPANVVMETADGEILGPIPLPGDFALHPNQVHDQAFTVRRDGAVQSILFPHASVISAPSAELRLKASLRWNGQPDRVLAEAAFSGEATIGEDLRLELILREPVALQEGEGYILTLENLGDSGLALAGSGIVNESSWDDGQPLRIEGRDGFGGLYIDHNLELYWRDDEDADDDGVSDKAQRIVQSLAAADYLVISSSRQYGSTGRVPQRHPINIAYYRALLGCPAPQDIERCVDRAEPGAIQGRLGYELVAVFQRDPALGPFRWRDQPSDESFTVYDHPKVLIFARSESFDPEKAREILTEVDTSDLIYGPPNELGAPPRDLMLPEGRAEQQRAGGTWSELFNRNSLINRSPILTVVVWWIVIGLFGLIAFPLVAAGLGGLHDRGYPLARLLGMLFIAWGSWFAGSLGLSYTRGSIALVMLILATISGAFAWRDREKLIAHIKARRKEILWIEALALAFFLFDLAIRVGNPDLWHRYLGGEKPMDFAYLNAVIKSSSFPPYDPWYAGGYINYYYFGFVLVGTPLKLLGVVPSVGYNLILPTLFALVALGAYSAGTNLTARLGQAYPAVRRLSPRLAGVAAAVALVVVGNLGTVRLIYEGLRDLGTAQGGGSGELSIGPVEALRGLGRLMTLQDTLPIGLHNWYWDPSRAIPPGEGEFGGPITEFPFFTFLYGDLHAHMINLPLTVIAVGFTLSILLAAEMKQERSWRERLSAIFLGALVLGALSATNTWDFPVYWVLGATAVFLAPLLRDRQVSLLAILRGGLTAAVLLGGAHLLYRPYHLWYGQAYTSAASWDGSRTPLDAYLTVHGLYLLVLLTWLTWETRSWMAATPLAALSRFRPYFRRIAVAALLLIAVLAILTAIGIAIAPLASLLMLWPALLLLRRNLAIEKRAVLVMIASAAALTFLVEVVVVRGDIGRMNTVFKFYLQVWTLFSLTSGAALVWLLADLPAWRERARTLWTAALALTVVCAALYTLTATVAKVKDRMTPGTSVTLDGMAFMAGAQYNDLGQTIPLAGDYHAIRWMQDNIQGSPVIVEAQVVEYRWGSRYSIYAGLPTVLGWNWHQRQQRAAADEADVSQRAQEITTFYLTGSTAEARRFIDRYDVSYVVVGELERLYYERLDHCVPIDNGARVSCSMEGRAVGMVSLDIPAASCELTDTGEQLSCQTQGLAKFERMEAEGLLRSVYQNADTTIYEVSS